MKPILPYMDYTHITGKWDAVCFRTKAGPTDSHIEYLTNDIDLKPNYDILFTAWEQTIISFFVDTEAGIAAAYKRRIEHIKTKLGK